MWKVIEDMYTDKQLEEATKRLCWHCERAKWFDSSDWRDTECHLYPICTDGSDCPYYKPKRDS